MSPGKQPFTDMPVSTEQIMHNGAYFGTRDNPTAVTIVPASGTAAYSNDLGEFETRLFLYQHLDRQDDAVRGAAGWDGDRYVVLDAAGGKAIAWASVWDTPADAADFYALAQQVRDAWKRAGRTVTVTTGEVAGRPVVLWTDFPSRIDADRHARERKTAQRPHSISQRYPHDTKLSRASCGRC